MAIESSSGAAAPKQRVGFIGLGDMGEPMAHNLLAKGFEVSVLDVRPGPLEAAKAKGARVAESPRQIAQECALIGLCVWSESQLLDCLYGEAGVFASDATERIVLIHSTVTPQVIQRVARSCSERGWFLLDAPVSGGRAGSEAGTLTLMVGGDAQAFQRSEAYLHAVGKNIFHMGEAPGSGAVAKLCNNVMALCNSFVLNEALKLAGAYGLDEKDVLRCARVSTGNSWFVENAGFFDNLLMTHPQPDVFYKDLWEAVEAGKQKGIEMTISGLVALSGPRLGEERKAILRKQGEGKQS